MTKHDRPLGYTQQLVLHLLADGQQSVRNLYDSGFGLSEDQIRGALRSLWKRSLVEREFHHGILEYYLTRSGQDEEQKLLQIEEDA